jgi:hypothetical protein
MKLIVKLIDPDGTEYYASEPDHEGLRYRTTKIQSAEIFPSQEKAEQAIVGLKQIRELKEYRMFIENLGQQ